MPNYHEDNHGVPTPDSVTSLLVPTPRSHRVVAARNFLTVGFRALRNRNYRLYWLSQVISLTGTWMQTTAQSWLVLLITGSPFALGLVSTLQFLPVTLLVLFGGVIADRLPKRRTIMITQALSLIQAAIFGLLVASDAIQLWHIYILAVTQGVVTAIDNPVRQAFAVELVGKDDLINAVALNSMVFNAARIAGPALAGTIMAVIGVAPTLLLNALSFVPVIIALWMMDLSKMFTAPSASTGSVVQKLVEGVSYARRTPEIMMVLIVVATIGTFGYNFNVTIPLIADKVLMTDSVGFGALWSFLGIGSLVAAIITAYTRRVTIARLMRAAAAFSVLFCLLALSRLYFTSSVLLVLVGFSGIIFATSSSTLLQLVAPDHLRGRVMSLQVMLFVGSTPLGAFLIGSMSQVLSVQVALIVCGILCTTGVGGTWLYQRSLKSQSN
jgi:MFS family permease